MHSSRTSMTALSAQTNGPHADQAATGKREADTSGTRNVHGIASPAGCQPFKKGPLLDRDTKFPSRAKSFAGEGVEIHPPGLIIRQACASSRPIPATIGTEKVRSLLCPLWPLKGDLTLAEHRRNG